jgi:2-succinyl-5-enolpyruvyl-6-hydroxy-3-cyclohexene-1-carboxylate synthase
LITGDLAFLYDRNALWNNYAHRGLKIIVINNGGGGIFQWIEGPQNHKKQLSFFTTPHRVGMEHLCAELNLEYIKATEKTLEKNLEKLFLDASKTSVLEIKTDMLQNATQQRKFMIKNNRI